MTVNVLGTEYSITVKKYEDDEAFQRLSIDGYCDGFTKQIVVCDMATYKGWENEPEKTISSAQKQTLRHEIVHAFLYESGLADSSISTDIGWAKNEEMVDWFAWKGPQIYQAWILSGAINTPHIPKLSSGVIEDMGPTIFVHGSIGDEI